LVHGAPRTLAIDSAQEAMTEAYRKSCRHDRGAVAGYAQ
jgi:hypothetical protein